jgi:hypothetical protein
MTDFTLLTDDRVAVLDLLAEHGFLTAGQVIVLAGGKPDVHSADYQRILKILKVLRQAELVEYDGMVYSLNKAEVTRWMERMGRWA